MIRHFTVACLLHAFLLSALHSENIANVASPTMLSVNDFLKLNPSQRAEVASQGGRAVVQGVLTSVGMSYCTIQDPNSFQSITCGFDPVHRAEYYSQRPGSRVQIIGIPIVGSNGLLTLSDSRIYDPNRPAAPQPQFQNAVFETTSIPSSSAPVQTVPSVSPPLTSNSTSEEPTSSETESASATNATDGNPQFIRRAVPRREGIGRSVSLYLGGSFAQSGDGSATVSPTLGAGFTGANSFDTRSQTGMTIGAKYAYSMSIKNNEGDIQPFIPGVEGELLYANFNHRGNLSGSGASGQYRTDLDILALMGSGTMKFNLTPFFPYLGLGAGFAYINGQNAQLRSSVTGVNSSLEDADDVALCGQAFVGLEYLLSKEWSLFGEYKYLHLQDLNLQHTNSTIDYDFLGLHFFNVGVRRYF